ncbi:MAG TPA: lipopolysaccharide kinase InaA family protein [Lentisphaeria bacterium]|nr:lipopolysaccharide kinase InaA family protein [Lentisphaeria bacterium]
MLSSSTTSSDQKTIATVPSAHVITAHTGKAWRRLRRSLLRGSPDGCCRVERLPDGILRYTSHLPREDIDSILHAEANKLPQANIKVDHKRIITRVWLRDKSYVLKTYSNLRRWLVVSPDCKGWLGAHQLDNGVACYAWLRKNDRSTATIIYADAGNRDLYMPEWSHSPDDNANALFHQAGTIIAALHRQNIFHADTKPGNFVYMDVPNANSRVCLIDTDDVRIYWRLSTRRRIKNLAQFMGCSREDIPTNIYITALAAFLTGYMEHYQSTPSTLLALFPAIADAMVTLYPERQPLNQVAIKLITEHLQAKSSDTSINPS